MGLDRNKWRAVCLSSNCNNFTISDSISLKHFIRNFSRNNIHVNNVDVILVSFAQCYLYSTLPFGKNYFLSLGKILAHNFMYVKSNFIQKVVFNKNNIAQNKNSSTFWHAYSSSSPFTPVWRIGPVDVHIIPWQIVYKMRNFQGNQVRIAEFVRVFWQAYSASFSSDRVTFQFQTKIIGFRRGLENAILNHWPVETAI